MALTDQLLAWYAFEENFDEEIYPVNSVPPHAAPLAVAPPAVGIQPFMKVRRATGFIGNCARFVTGESYMYGEDSTILRFDTPKTFAFRFKFTSPLNAQNFILLKSGEYGVQIDAATQRLKVSGAFGTFVLHSLVLQPETWYSVAFWNVATGAPFSYKVFVQINNGVPESDTLTISPAGAYLLVGGISVTFDGYLDELAVWDRNLTAAELTKWYNNGDGVSYDSLIAQALTAPCRSVECCDDNPAAYVSAVGDGKGYDSSCEPYPQVLFEPPSGNRVIMPSLVALRSDVLGAVIHYTTDGSAPDRNSPVYSAPITVSAPADVIRAIAIVEGCPEGPEGAAQYQQWTPAAHFTYACTTTDKTGPWGAFAADGNPDYNWQIQIQVSAVTSVKQFELLQLFADGSFSGAAWSTKEFILPWQNDQTKKHRAFPLVIFKGGIQQNVAYLDDYSATVGNFGIGAHTLDLYGSPWTSLPATSLFKLRILFSDGTLVERIVDSTCDALPGALCPVPVVTSYTPQCGPPLRVDITYSLGVGTQRKIFRATNPAGPYTELASGAVAASPETFQDSTVVAGQRYYYYLANIPAGCVAYVNSGISSALAIPPASVAISASAATINFGQSVTISWSSINNNGTVSISPTIGAQPGNVGGNQVVSPATTTTYTITGQNICGNIVTANVTVTVIPAASCAIGAQPALVGIVGYSSSFFGSGGCNFRTGGIVAWNGQFANTPVGFCSFLPAPPPTGTVQYHFGSDIVPNRELHLTQTSIVQSGGLWTLNVVGYDPGTGDPVPAWVGTKATGNTPIGTYTRVSGCSPIPSSLSVIAV